jgi:hypothetical protein
MRHPHAPRFSGIDSLFMLRACSAAVESFARSQLMGFTPSSDQFNLKSGRITR